MSADLGACWQVKGLLEALKTTTQEMDTRFQSSIDQDLSSLKELETAVRAAVDGLSERVTGLETGCGKQDNRLGESRVRQKRPFPHKTSCTSLRGDIILK